MKNYALIRDVLQTIHDNPEQWDQGKWSRTSSCGTTMCFAGWTTHISGYEIDKSCTVTMPNFSLAIPGHEVIEVDAMCFVNGESVTISEAAADVLGLNESEISALFYNMSDTVEELSRVVERWVREDSDLWTDAIVEDEMHNLLAKAATARVEVTA